MSGGGAKASSGASIERDALVAYLDEYLAIREWRDRSLNGLQVEGKPAVARIALATDAALATFTLAADAGAEFLIAHHGLFWGEVLPIRGPHRARVAALLAADISLYAAHLPLDGHPQVGNNAVLARLMGLENLRPFGRHGDLWLGVEGRLPKRLGLSELAARLEALLSARPDVLDFGRSAIERVAIVSGDGSDLIAEAAEAGVDVFVTGETSHVAWHAARELALNVVFAGHYATETLGVRALGDHLSKRFGVEAVFLDSPTGY